jgi:hypothetical protein
MTRHRRFWVGVVLAALVAACSGDDGGDEPVELEDAQPIVAVEPCDLLDADTAEQLSGAEVKEPEAVVEDDGTTSCSFDFADEADAETAGSSVAALLEIGPGDEDDVPGGSLARSLDMGDASAVEEEEDKVTVVYVVQTVVVFVEVAPGSGEVTPEMVDDVVEFTETTEPVVTEAVTGEPFVPDVEETTTTEFVDDEVPEGEEISVDGGPATGVVERAGGVFTFVFEAEAGDIIFTRMPEVTFDAEPNAGCIDVQIINPEDVQIAGTCAFIDGESILDRTVLELDGVYAINIDPRNADTGSVTLEITSATDESGTMEIDGDEVTGTIEQAGAISVFEFEVDAPTFVFTSFPTVVLDGAENAGCIDVRIVDPEGVQIAGTCAFIDGASFLDRTELPTTGTYTLVIDARNTDTGSVAALMTSTT